MIAQGSWDTWILGSWGPGIVGSQDPSDHGIQRSQDTLFSGSQDPEPRISGIWDSQEPGIAISKEDCLQTVIMGFPPSAPICCACLLVVSACFFAPTLVGFMIMWKCDVFIVETSIILATISKVLESHLVLEIRLWHSMSLYFTLIVPTYGGPSIVTVTMSGETAERLGA